MKYVQLMEIRCIYNMLIDKICYNNTIHCINKSPTCESWDIFYVKYVILYIIYNILSKIC